MSIHYLRLEIVRILRDPKYLALAVLAPIGFYLLFATIFGGGPTPPGELDARTEIMVAMAAYGGIWAVLSTTGPRISEERQVGWFDQIRTMPVSAWQVLSAKVAASVLMALPAIVLVCLTGAIVKGVALTPGQWVALVSSMWAGTVAFAAMGIAIGYAVGSDVAYALSYGLYTAMSALGGLFAPPAVLPDAMLTVARALPSYQLANLGWHIAAGEVPDLMSVVVLAAWTLGFAVIAFVAYRRPALSVLTRTRRHADKLAV
ncbi:ABC transporter permease [Leifsonia shinshuensis]|uniref:ABC transporter permease n=1 Tax=Leifsonia shinshuensis TaxID=150026 RepID=UPI001F505520|nr:ABC transporter permease [Leifsonia shinshuensis]MCI0156288.1 ABC transporter permease [Leifsonia shinshuensis]